VAPFEIGIAAFAPDDQVESGDLHIARGGLDHLLLAVIDGIGHGKSAAAAARAAASVLESNSNDSLVSLVQLCHEELRSSRGVVLSLASIDFRREQLIWLGVGNVQCVVVRSGAARGSAASVLMLRAGVVGKQLPVLQTATVPISSGDTLIFATDGIRTEFQEDLIPNEPAQKCADRILNQYCKYSDDALVLVARLMGSSK
jgi:serine phosphatase RsbU (regulator of sigma subunit)